MPTHRRPPSLGTGRTRVDGPHPEATAFSLGSGSRGCRAELPDRKWRTRLTGAESNARHHQHASLRNPSDTSAVKPFRSINGYRLAASASGPPPIAFRISCGPVRSYLPSCAVDGSDDPLLLRPDFRWAAAWLVVVVHSTPRMHSDASSFASANAAGIAAVFDAFSAIFEAGAFRVCSPSWCPRG